MWTHNQFIDGTTIKGQALGLKIAAGNVPSFIDLQTGEWGTTIQDPLNSGQTPTMANFATLANLLSACATRVKADACSKLFAAAMPPKGNPPSDTLSAAQTIARYPWYQPERLFALMDEFYPIPEGKNLRAVWRPDCLADDAVSCEPVSAVNSLLTGKITGKFAKTGHPIRFSRLINTEIQ